MSCIQTIAIYNYHYILIAPEWNMYRIEFCDDRKDPNDA